MIIIISPEKNIEKETLWVNQLLEKGLEYFHIRKPHFSNSQLADYIYRIDEQYFPKLVIHNNETIANELGINRIHYNEQKRIENKSLQKDKIYSTSVHSIHDFNQLSSLWKYAFLSPMYESISKKNYGKNNTKIHTIIERTNTHTSLIALGGITAQNIRKTLEMGANGVGLLGYIWLSKNPLNAFLQCKTQDHLY